ncbi:MAG TPA: POTRA domain-containing protein [Vicinamibacterales bacterium]|nr:POTRA domain-containing protein [Vicinamibacterales bacterium]
MQQEGAAVTDPLILSLVQTRTGMPLAMADVRETITHLISLTRYEDVQVYEDPAAGGVRLRYVLVPVHAVDRIEFRGMLGVSEDVLRRAVVSRFGNAPVASRAEDVARSLQGVYRERGYTQPAITPRIEISHRPDRASLVLEINAGPRAAIGQVDVDADDPADRGALANTGIAVGAPYDAAAIDTQLEKYQAALRARGYYEARATHNVDFVNGGVSVHVAIDRGPHVLVAFAGDPLPEADRERLVPIRAEASADEDLLEDSSRAIEDYFHARGYRDAMALYTRDESVPGEVTVRFTISRGPRYVVDALAITGNMSMATTELAPIVRLKAGDVFVQGALDAAVTGIHGLYRARGFTRPMVMPAVAVLPAGDRPAPADDRHVQVTIGVTEGPRTFVNAVDLRGNMVFSDAELRAPLATAPGKTYSELDVASDRDRIDLEYRNRGYETVVVDPGVMLAEGDTLANVLFSITEGPQVIVDHVIVVGNRRTSLSTIQRELTLRPGEPLGYAARIESQQRLSALGLFRRVNITELTHESESRRDVLVQVEEAPPTTISYGAGLEGQTILRPTGPNGQAEERFELAPRGSFEIARNNLWGKNRSVDLFTRASLKPRDVLAADTNAAVAEPVTNSSKYGFNEYRVLGTYREPKLFNSPADLLVTAILDQAKRSSFNFRTREVRGEAGMHVTRFVSVAGRYAFQHTKLFDEKFAPDDPVVPLIDRLFPQVRLSKFSNSLIRDSRDDLLDPSRGSFLALNSDLAARGIGSQVGFVKTFAQAFEYVRLPVRRRIILATAERVGLAHGFSRLVETVQPDGTTTLQTVEDDLPASERFFAGGDTTVRGFSLDRLGTAATISQTSGFPTGGNGEVVLNAELRIDLVKGFAGVTFVDAGNIFLRASDVSLTDLRPAAGFGVHYKSPIGPIRVELGFNLAPRELVPGVREKRTVLHISLGQAF